MFFEFFAGQIEFALWFDRMSAQLLLAKVLTSAVKSKINVQVTSYKFDKFFTCHFKDRTNLEALDQELQTKPGDWVLLEKLPEKYSLTVEHRVRKLVWQQGNIIDPITGKRCVETDFEEDLDREALLMNGKTLTERIEELKATKTE